MPFIFARSATSRERRDRVDEGAEGGRQHVHALGLGAQLEQVLLGVGRQLDPGGDPVGVHRLELGLLGRLAADALDELGERLAGLRGWRGLIVRARRSADSTGSTSPAGYSVASKRSSTRNGRSPVTMMFRRPSSKRSVTSVTRASQPIRRAPPSSSRKTIPNGSSSLEAAGDHPLVALLEDVQRQQLARQQHQRKLEDRELDSLVRHGRSLYKPPMTGKNAPAMAEIDFEAEGLLEGLEGDAREARRKLLDELADDGVEPRRAAHRGRRGPARAARRSSGSSAAAASA